MYSVALAERGIAREADPGAGHAAGIAEHHPLQDHGRAQVVGDLVHAAVFACLRRLPRRQHRVDGCRELIDRVSGGTPRRSAPRSARWRVGELLELSS